jgi:hypothetical protein
LERILELSNAVESALARTIASKIEMGACIQGVRESIQFAASSGSMSSSIPARLAVMRYVKDISSIAQEDVRWLIKTGYSTPATQRHFDVRPDDVLVRPTGRDEELQRVGRSKLRLVAAKEEGNNKLSFATAFEATEQRQMIQQESRKKRAQVVNALEAHKEWLQANSIGPN